MSPETLCLPSRRDRKRAETREKLLEVAMSLIAEHGFDQVTVEMITDRADVAKGTFFNYFASKEAVVEGFFQSQMERAVDAIETAQFVAHQPGSTWDLIIQVIHLIAERDGRTKNLTRTLLALSLTNEEVRVASRNVSDRGCDTGRWLIERAQAAGEIRADLPADEVAHFIMSAYFAVLRDWACDMSSEDLHGELDKRLRLIYQGLQPSGETSAAALS